MPVDQFHQEGYSHMKKSITLSLALAASLGLAACGEKAADNAATTDDTTPVEGAADGAMDAASDATDAADRKSVESGKSVSVRVDLGGLRIIEKKKNYR